MILHGVRLSRRYGATTVVADVDVGVRAGEVVGLLGPNGAGKSTTFRLLAGLERPDAGRVTLLGRDVTAWPLDRRVRHGLGYLPQHASVFPRLTAEENLALALRAAGRDAAEAVSLLTEVGLGAVIRRPAGALSGGERRRLELVRCLALAPRVVLLDEPFAGVDPAHVGAIRHTVRGLAAQGLGVLLTDHAVRDALSICDRAILLDGGAVLVAGTPTEVADDARARARYLGHDFCLLPPVHPLHATASSYNGATDVTAAEKEGR